MRTRAIGRASTARGGPDVQPASGPVLNESGANRVALRAACQAISAVRDGALAAARPAARPSQGAPRTSRQPSSVPSTPPATATDALASTMHRLHVYKPRKRRWDDEADRKRKARRHPKRRRPGAIGWLASPWRTTCGRTSGQPPANVRSPKSWVNSSSARSRGIDRNGSGMVGSSRAISLRCWSVLATSRTTSPRSFERLEALRQPSR